MGLRNYANLNPIFTLTSGVSDSATVLPVGSTLGSPDTPFLLALERRTSFHELALCTDKDETTFTVTRGFDGVGPFEHDADTSVEHVVAAIDYREANEHVNTPHLDLEGVTAKGDIFAGTSGGEMDVLPVGADGSMLVPDASQPTGLRYLLGRGIQVVTSTTRPTGTLRYEGVRIFETDTDLEYLWTGAAWIRSNTLGSWSTYTPTWGSAGTAPAIGNGQILGRYWRAGKMLHVWIRVAAGSTTTRGSSNVWYVTIPTGEGTVAVDTWMDGMMLYGSLLYGVKVGFTAGGTAGAMFYSSGGLYYGMNSSLSGFTTGSAFAVYGAVELA